MQLLRGRDSLPVGLDLRFQLGLPGCFASRRTLCIQLVLAGVVVGPTAPAVAGLAVRPAPTRLAASTPKSASTVITPQRGRVSDS
jgi:hypothetical protein